MIADPNVIILLHDIYRNDGMSFADGSLETILRENPTIRHAIRAGLVKVKNGGGFDPMEYIVLTANGYRMLGLDAPQTWFEVIKQAIVKVLHSKLT